MSGSKMTMAAAVMLTVVLCAAGMYLLTQSGDTKEDVYVTVTSDVAEDAKLLLAEFETYVNATIHISVADPAELMSLDGADVMITGDRTTIEAFDSESINGLNLKMSEDSGTMLILYRPGTEGMAGRMINWLIFLSDSEE
ncbi:MAG: hypothetical protein FWG58_00610 [Methanomassiliicoccaceae archaeon]|nr:hypothetical protein [Methanomassiliicoccaceae archaeon]